METTKIECPNCGTSIKLENNEYSQILSQISDKEISEDFFEVFDNSDNFDLGSLFVEARAKNGLTQEMAAKLLKVRSSFFLNLIFKTWNIKIYAAESLS